MRRNGPMLARMARIPIYTTQAAYRGLGVLAAMIADVLDGASAVSPLASLIVVWRDDE